MSLVAATPLMSTAVGCWTSSLSGTWMARHASAALFHPPRPGLHMSGSASAMRFGRLHRSVVGAGTAETGVCRLTATHLRTA